MWTPPLVSEVPETPFPDSPVPAGMAELFQRLGLLALALADDGTILWASAPTRERAAELTGRRIAELGWFPAPALRNAVAIAARGESVTLDGRVTLPGEPPRVFARFSATRLSSPGGAIVLAGVDITERVQVEERHALLSREMNHRTRNLFSVIRAIATQTFARGGPAEEIRDVLLDRLQSLSRCQAALMETGWVSADLAKLAADELAAFTDRATVRGGRLALRPGPAQTVALILHELATNAAKYGSLSVPAGEVEVGWFRDGEHIILSWTESGGPPVSPPRRKGFGRTLVGRLAEQEFGAAPEIDFAVEGLRYRVRIPVAMLAD